MTESDGAHELAALAAEIQETVKRAGLGARPLRNSEASRNLDVSQERGEPPADSVECPETASKGRPPSAFVTWAHRHQSWTDHEAQNWERTVAEFTTVLRQLGINADVDLYHLDEAGVDWTRYGQRAVAEHDFVLIAASVAWAERWAGTNNPKSGAGAAAEADMLKGLFQQNQADFQRRTQVVLLPGVGPEAVPLDLARLIRHSVDPSDADTVLPLIRSLTGQARYPVPPLGTVPTLPPTLRRAGVTSGSYGPEADFGAVFERTDSLRSALKGTRGVQRSEVLQRIAALEGILDAITQEY